MGSLFWRSASLLLRETPRVFFPWRDHSSGAKARRENEEALHLSPPRGERSSEARVRGPLSESERCSPSPAERPPHPDLLPARGEKEALRSARKRVGTEPSR